MRFRYYGQSLTEYALAGACILGISIVALTQLGSVVSNQFGNMMGKSQDVAAISPPASTVSGSVEGSGVIMPSTAPKGGLKPSEMMNVKALESSELINTVTTTGANGATSLLSDKLTTAAEELLKSGEIDQQQYNNLVNLANQGHKLADIAGLIETSVKQAKTPEEAAQMKVQYNGKTMTLNELADLIGYKDGVWGIPEDIYNFPGDVGSELKGFIDLYKSVSSDGSMGDPNVKALVSQLSSDIITINESVSEGYEAVTIYDKAQPSEISNQIGSTLTDMKSSQICGAGNGKDSGTSCHQG